ncbi:TatD family hydrolase [uncultured Aquitalea sp.]|uniref:TatD family hydrolase n=2 Tax=uncultured Aquitalea sp. TaxID=540272 RepID=UPI0025DE9087|nr:TatD family hydrolase [uncultured Aquitalea sp.]
MSLRYSGGMLSPVSAMRFSPLPAPSLIDTHCHLDAPEFAERVDAVAADAAAAGLGQLLVPSVSRDSFASTLAMRERFGCWIALGLHPIYINQHLDAHLAELETLIRQETPQAVGEIGLDFYVPGLDAQRQEWLFAEQLKLARRYDLPVILHVRRSQDRILKYLRQIPVRGGIAHAFNGSRQQADMFIKLGFKLGFGGTMSYSGSRRIRELAATLPIQHIVLETDAPDIPPEWAQSLHNVPANLPRLAKILAELRNIDLDEMTRTLWRNSLTALGLAP